MASRRLPATRSRTNAANSIIPPAPSTSRPRSVLAKSNSSHRSGLTTPIEEQPAEVPPIPKPSRTQSQSQPQEHSETNIRVVIRCRRRSEREIQENSPIIVTTNGPRGDDVTIEAAVPVSSLGVVTLPPTRTYPFDAVFGPEADQALLYNDVVNPMLDEVLAGYNCTLFAYGQTGTGKTYTMQGDLTTTPMGNPSAHAGMIPRVLIRLFNQLESSRADYSVKISFVELYNEELRDLLASELAAPVGSTQPMGLGASKESSGLGNLKIFDDATKKGVFIQGLEEACVKDAADALALLTKGSQRRQIAATKFNDHSSRSHSVFSVTVHTKETSTMGEDLLKVGKLNLVDLAGSENIGRSGAENKRAREAGMINQSLLTLGRVINALVDRSAHVPYRESKLTRLLQDSLGGHTKTCIIATISPARCNMEETLSTLDYAIRAKSIRNRPEVNQRMTQNALIKEYVALIGSLRANVHAAREKNGIYFAEESWNQMATEQELRETEIQEARKQIEIYEAQLKNVREEFEQSMMLLMKRDEELKETRERLKITEGELAVRETQLEMVKGALEEEVIVRQAYQDNETTLHGVLGGLKGVVHDSVSHVGGLHAKLERKTTVLASNIKAVSAHSESLTTGTQTLTQQLEAFVEVFSQHLQKLKTDTDQLHTKECEALSRISAQLDEQMEKLRGYLHIVHSKEEISSEALDILRTSIEDTTEGIKASFSAWSVDLRKHCESTCKAVEASIISSCALIEVAFKELSSINEAIVQQAQSYINAKCKSLQEAQALADSTKDAEILYLRQQNALLTRMLESEEVKAERDGDELKKRISEQLTDFIAERSRSWRETLSEIPESNAIAEKKMVQVGQEQGRLLEAVFALGKDWSAQLEKRGSEGKRTRDGGLKTLADTRTVIRDGLSDVQNSTMSSTAVFSNDLQQQTQNFGTSCGEAFERVSRAKRARIEATDTMATEVHSVYRYVQRGMASTSRNIEAASGRIMSESSSLSVAIDTYSTAATSHIADLRQATQSLTAEGMKEDRPSGITPRKRSWSYVDEWQPTKGRDVVLKEWRQRGVTSTGSETFIAEHLPLPEEDSSEGQSSLHVKLLSSSAPSTLSPSPPLLGMKKIADGVPKSKLPSTMGTLTERSTNVLAARGSRRIHR
ncbi:P-loop containing nucleoside triphosphate hydrolase protein [Sparassis latifolia]